MKTADDALFLPFNGFMKSACIPPISILLLATAPPIPAISPPSNFSSPYPSAMKASTAEKNAELAVPQLSIVSSYRRDKHTSLSLPFAARYMTKCMQLLLYESNADTVGCFQNVALAVFQLNRASLSLLLASFSCPLSAPSPPLFPLTGTGMCCGDNLSFEQGGSASLSLTRAEFLK